MMERTKGEGGDGRVGVGDDDLGDGMQCSDHPYRNNPGVICVLCLQEKLGKLVSSSFPLPIRPSPSSSSSSPPPFTSDSSGNGGGGASLSSLSVVRSMSARNDNDTDHYEECYMRKARIPFLLAKKKKKMDASSDHPYHHHHHHHHGANIVFKRSKSIAAPIRGRKLDKASSAATPPATLSAVATVATGGASSSGPKDKSLVSSRKADIVVIEDDDSPRNEATPSTGSSFERKVSRSRSVGCGSRSFSGDFFERISTGFGDCTQRRVESQREGKTKTSTAAIGALSAMKEKGEMRRHIRRLHHHFIVVVVLGIVFIGGSEREREE
ncbi:Nodulin MtN3 family protein [Hibiscus syriacus]|uniref:Nodulin MtN3 family protein n=1 Tax=Hibiscus syriacus TaxID=106335 RepID=A0A6A3D9P5_HIBSY|nr:Nodulin MtN3 family protein [Hibiscus syriacus]